jgi:GTPase involved in cell partitioning and DNA repair
VGAEERGGDGGHGRDVLLHVVPDDLLRARAAVRVEPVLQLRARGDSGHHQHQRGHSRHRLLDHHQLLSLSLS